MPADHPAIMAPVNHAHHCVLSIKQVDDLNHHAHRIVLYGNLIANVLEGNCKPEENKLMEGLGELVGTIMADAEAIEALSARGCQTAAKGGD